MSLFFRDRAPESRALTYETVFGSDVRKTAAGVSVTQESALRLGAVWASVNLLASIVSNFPVDVIRGSGPTKQTVTPTPRFVESPSLLLSRREWVYQAMVSLLLRGNAYGVILERGPQNLPTVVEWAHPDTVQVDQPSQFSRLVYRVDGFDVTDRMIHMRGFTRPGSGVGMSPVEYAAEGIGIGLAAQKFGGEWFGQGAHPSAIFKSSTQKVSDEDAQKAKRRIKAILTGNREPLVLGKDWDYQQIQVSANESQFLDAMGYTDAQIARLFGPGLAEILGYGNQGSTLTYSNRVDRSLDLLTYAVMPWVSKFDDMFTAALPKPQFARMNVAGLLRADPKSQREMFRIDREIGLRSIDEIRDLIDEPPLPDGAGADYTPLGKSASTPTTGGPTNGNQ